MDLALGRNSISAFSDLLYGPFHMSLCSRDTVCPSKLIGSPVADLRANVQGQRDFDIRVQKAVQAATESLLKQADIKDLHL